MRKYVVAALLLLAATVLSADGPRIGASLNAEFLDRPDIEAFLDPFVEAGFGAAGRSDITNYEKVGAGTNDYIPTNLSLFGQVGGGLAVKPAVLQVGAKLGWRFWNGALPGATQDPYPLKNFSVALFGGSAF